MATRQATLLSRAVSTKETVRRAAAHSKDAQKAHRAALLNAVEGGITIQVLATATGTSWSRVNKLIKRASTERVG